MSASSSSASVEARELVGPYAQLVLEVTRTYPEASIDTFQTMLGLFSTYDAAITLLSRRMAREALTVPGFNVLMLLAHGDLRRDGCPMHKLGELLVVSRANVTGLVDSLERKGLVERKENAQDRRSKLVRITSAGDKKLAGILPDHFLTLRRTIEALKPKDRKQLWRLLGELRASFQEAIARETDA